MGKQLTKLIVALFFLLLSLFIGICGFMFLEDYDLRDLVVAMDPEAKTGKQYQVQGLPHTVIIGPSGTVEKVWVGFSPFLENDLVAEIDRLLLK